MVEFGPVALGSRAAPALQSAATPCPANYSDKRRSTPSARSSSARPPSPDPCPSGSSRSSPPAPPCSSSRSPSGASTSGASASRATSRSTRARRACSSPTRGASTELLIKEGDEVKAGDADGHASRSTAPPARGLHERGRGRGDADAPRHPREGAGPVARAGRAAGGAGPPAREGPGERARPDRPRDEAAGDAHQERARPGRRATRGSPARSSSSPRRCVKQKQDEVTDQEIKLQALMRAALRRSSATSRPRSSTSPRSSCARARRSSRWRARSASCRKASRRSRPSARP